MDEALHNSTFLKACRGEETDFTPIWLNRQAGRYMPEYHQVKGETKSLDFFKTPELAAKATCDAGKRGNQESRFFQNAGTCGKSNLRRAAYTWG